MGDKVDYLAEYEGLEKKEFRDSYLSGLKESINRSLLHRPSFSSKGAGPKYQDTPKDRGLMLGIARKGLDEDMKKAGTPQFTGEGVLRAIQVYENLGLGNRESVKRKIVEMKRKSSKSERDDFWNVPRNDLRIRNYLSNEHEGKVHPSVSSKLERSASLALFLCFVGGIFFVSPSITGNVVAGLERGASSNLGVVLLMLVFIGMFLFRKK